MVFSITETGISMMMQVHPRPLLVVRAGLIVLLLGLVWAAISVYTDKRNTVNGGFKLSLVASLVLLIGTGSVGFGIGLMI